jgi:polysaccharide deacetylase family protein (PEP-CTERM system associated)
MINAITFDVEEWFQANSLSSKIKFSDWHYHESRIEKNVYRILAVLRRKETKATFFVLGWIAEKYPDLVENIALEGHEIASHGYRHKSVNEQSPGDFEDDLLKSMRLLRNITGQNVIGYRAPNFSIAKRSLWALKMLEKNGVRYDSSIIPAKNMQRYIHTTNQGVIEFPLSTVRLFGKNIPVASGGCLRNYPYSVTKAAIKSINKKAPAIVQLHSWEVDKKQPRVNIGRLNSIRHYRNLHTTIPKLKMLLKDFQFDSVRNVLFGDKEII